MFPYRQRVQNSCRMSISKARGVAFAPSYYGRELHCQKHVAQFKSLYPKRNSLEYHTAKMKRSKPIVCSASTLQTGLMQEPLDPSKRMPVEIIALRENWVAVNKPPGILVHRTKLYPAKPGEKYLVDEVKHAVEAVLGCATDVFPVQRLDRPTSGVMVFALHDSKNASQLQNALQSEDSCKQYWTLAFGADMPVKWENHHPLRDLTGKVRKQRPASSAFEQLLRLDESDMSVVRATIATGRRHQIRRHLSNSRHPVVGDTSHGKGALNRMAREQFGVTRCCLHSRKIAFKDPTSCTRIELEASVPQDIRNILFRLPDFCKSTEDVLNLGTLT